MYKRLSFLILVSTIFIFACASSSQKEKNKPEPVTAETALQSYLDNGDSSYKYELKEQYKIGELNAYDLLLTSQNWRDHVWTHQLTILVPKEVKYDGVLLYITGGSIENGLPRWKSKEEKDTPMFAHIAEKNQAIAAIIRQTPNQPLYNDLVEDQLISFTLHNFKNDGDFTWPLLFPMVKSAVKAMDAIQDFTKNTLEVKTQNFTVCGGSKRGWTTWLTAASDPRVEAIGPMVIDVLNMPVSLDYHLEAWNEYSIQIEDYTKLEIPQSVNTPSGNAITTMVDPYSYRAKLTIPKMIFIGTNDEYWPVDAIKHYINDIPGENYIHYVPNAGHDLGGGEQALRALSAFWGKTLTDSDYAVCDNKITSDNLSAVLEIKTSSDELLNAYLWSADSDDRDFRDEQWNAKSIDLEDKSKVNYKINFPEKGFKAFYIDLEYSDPNGGKYTKSTRMYVADTSGIL